MALGIVFLLVWLILLVRFPRIMFPASGILVAIFLLLAAAVGIWQWRHEQQVSRLEFSIHYTPHTCDFGKPLQVRIHNTSHRTTSHLSWQLRATQPGYNTNLLDIGVTSNTYQLSLPLHPDEQWQKCYALPPLRRGYRAADLQYQADHIRANFQQ